MMPSLLLTSLCTVTLILSRNINSLSEEVLSNSSYPGRPTATGVLRKNKEFFLKEWESPYRIKDVRNFIYKYASIVPVIGGWNNRTRGSNNSVVDSRSFLETRQELFDAGVYPGVEYRVMDILASGESLTDYPLQHQETPQDACNVTLLLRPVYPLITQLERDWPVEIEVSRVPCFLTRGMYNSVSVLVSATFSLAFFLSAIAVSTVLTLSVVNSRSMQPTIQPKDVLLVEKLSPRLSRLAGLPVASTEDVVFFSAPPSFQEYLDNNNRIYRDNIRSSQSESALTVHISSSSSSVKSIDNNNVIPGRRYLPPVRSSELLVKRVKSVMTHPVSDIDVVMSSPPGGGPKPEYKGMKMPEQLTCLDVRGDNPPVSLDSRQWGCLAPDYVVGRPLLRIFPLSRFGVVK